MYCNKLIMKYMHLTPTTKLVIQNPILKSVLFTFKKKKSSNNITNHAIYIELLIGNKKMS